MLAKGQVATLDDFARLTVHGRRVRKFGGGRGAAMGHKEQLAAFVSALRGEPSGLLSWEEASVATLSVFAAQESIRTGEVIDLRDFREAVVRGDGDTTEVTTP